MEESILKTIKQLIGCPDDFEQFDLDLTIHINSAFAALTQLELVQKKDTESLVLIMSGVNSKRTLRSQV